MIFHIAVPPLPPIPSTAPEAFASRADFFKPEEVDRINEIAFALPSRPVTVGPDSKVDPEGNVSHVRHLMPGPDTNWIYQRVLHAAAQLNALHFQFDITGMDEPMYHVTYKGEEKGHYNWHIDANNPGRPRRKLAITFQLSDGDAYEGGDLEINMTGIPVRAPRDKGALITFPATHIHRVAPVTKGTRSAIVTWIVGPPFR